MTTLSTSRKIPATVEQVFTALSDPKRLAQWWGPAGFTNTFNICEFKNGGLWSYTMHGPDGKSYPNESVFAEIEPSKKVIIEHISKPKYRLIIALDPSEKGTTVSWSQTFEKSKFADSMKQFLTTANEQNLDRLSAEVLAKTSRAERKGDKMPTNTIRLHRVLRTTPEKLYKAFLEPEAIAKWIAPDGFTCKVHHMDAKEGGTHKMSFTNFTTGRSHSFGGTYLELVPGKRIRYTDKFDDANLPGEMLVTVELKKVLCGTELSIIQENIPAAIPAEMCYLGWQESLSLLARLVEPEINE